MKALILLPLIFAWVEAVPCLHSELLCEFDHETHPAKECFAKLSAKIQDSIKTDCAAYLGKEEFDAFRKNIEVICEAKGASVGTVEICSLEITTTPLDLSICQLDEPSHPMHDCYSLMGEQIQKSLKVDCLANIGTDAMDDFMKNGDVICKAKKSNILPNELTTATPPMVFVDPCDLDNEDHMAHDCYSLMGAQIQESIKADCIAAGPTPARTDLAKNIEALCKAKGSEIRQVSLTTTMPPDFTPCDFDVESHPIHNCYNQMGSEIQKSVKADCLANYNTPDIDAFKNNILLICRSKESGGNSP